MIGSCYAAPAALELQVLLPHLPRVLGSTPGFPVGFNNLDPKQSECPGERGKAVQWSPMVGTLGDMVDIGP